MKKNFAACLMLLLLSGCGFQNKELDQALALRTKILKADSCHFQTDITADYADKQHRFSLECDADQSGSIHFTVLEPQSISGIEGIIDGQDGKLTFEETVLFFPLLADGQVTPVCAPWLLMKTLRSGFITAAGASGDLCRLTIDDSYDDDALQLDIWLNENLPVRAEILYRNRKILSLDVKNFRIE